MMYLTDVNKLISMWQDRKNNSKCSPEYKDAVNDCIYDLSTFMDNLIEEDIQGREAVDSMIADEYLATIDAHMQ